MAVSLWEVAKMASGLEIEVFTVKAVAIGGIEQGMEELAGFLGVLDGGQSLDQPEGANGEGTLGFSEVILIAVAIHETVFTEPFDAFLHR